MKNYRNLLTLAFFGMLFVGAGGIAQPEIGRPTDLAQLPPGALQKLSLTEDQKEKILSLQRQSRKEIISLESQMRIKRIELEEMMDSENVSEKEVMAKVKEIGQLHTEIMMARTKMMLGLKKILTKEQIRKLKSMRMGRRGERKGKLYPRRKKGHPPYPGRKGPGLP